MCTIRVVCALCAICAIYIYICALFVFILAQVIWACVSAHWLLVASRCFVFSRQAVCVSSQFPWVSSRTILVSKTFPWPFISRPTGQRNKQLSFKSLPKVAKVAAKDSPSRSRSSLDVEPFSEAQILQITNNIAFDTAVKASIDKHMAEALAKRVPTAIHDSPHQAILPLLNQNLQELSLCSKPSPLQWTLKCRDAVASLEKWKSLRLRTPAPPR